MGQKTNPIALRPENNYLSCWYANSGQEYGKFLIEDIKVREFITQKFSCKISKIEIRRRRNGDLSIIVHVIRGGAHIRNKESIGKIKDYIKKIRGGEKVKGEISVDISDVKMQDVDAQAVGMRIAQQIESRGSIKKAANSAISSAMRSGAKGVKVLISGRINGAEIARRETYGEGSVPLHTFKADIRFASVAAKTTYGAIGVKVWLYI